MATYVVLLTFTDQGIHNIKDTTKRAAAFTDAAKSAGVTVKEMYWTLGQYDIVAIIDGPDDVVITAIGLGLGKAGNVRTQTLRAFSLPEMETILAKLP